MFAGSKNRLTSVVLACFLNVGWCSAVKAFEISECFQTRPVIQNFEHYDEFIIELLKFKKTERSCVQIREQIKATEEREKEIADMHRHPELVILNAKTGLESLNVAIQKAKTYTRPVTAANARPRGKSTSQNFSFPKMKGSNMSSASIGGALGSGGALARQFNLTDTTDEEHPPPKQYVTHKKQKGLDHETNPGHDSTPQVRLPTNNSKAFLSGYIELTEMRQDGGTDTLRINSVKLGDKPVVITQYPKPTDF